MTSIKITLEEANIQRLEAIKIKGGPKAADNLFHRLFTLGRAAITSHHDELVEAIRDTAHSLKAHQDYAEEVVAHVLAEKHASEQGVTSARPSLIEANIDRINAFSPQVARDQEAFFQRLCDIEKIRVGVMHDELTKAIQDAANRLGVYRKFAARMVEYIALEKRRVQREHARTGTAETQATA